MNMSDETKIETPEEKALREAKERTVSRMCMEAIAECGMRVTKDGRIVKASKKRQSPR